MRNQFFKKLLIAVLIALVPVIAHAGRNGSGTYTAPSNSWNPAVSGQTLSSADWNTTLTDLETGLTNSIAVDGQTTITGNIPFNNNKITGLGAGTAANDAAPLTQIQGAAYAWLTASGTDTITGNLSPTPTGYTTGMRVAFAAAAANSGATTLNLNSLGAKALTKYGSTALVANDILSGQVVYAVYDGTRFQMLNPSKDFAVAAITSGTITGLTTLGLPTATSPAQTTEGYVVWDSDDDVLTVGDGTARKQVVNTDPVGVTGADKVINVMSLTAAEYGVITPNASTLYVVTP